MVTEHCLYEVELSLIWMIGYGTKMQKQPVLTSLLRLRYILIMQIVLSKMG